MFRGLTILAVGVIGRLTLHSELPFNSVLSMRNSVMEKQMSGVSKMVALVVPLALLAACASPPPPPPPAPAYVAPAPAPVPPARG